MSFRACEESHGVCGAAGRCLYLAKLQGPQTKWAVAGGRRGPPLRQESSFNACRGLPRCPERPARLCNTLSALRATSPVRGSQSKNNLTIMSFRACEESHGVCGAAGRCLYLAKLQGPQTKWAVAGGRRGPPLRQESSFNACRGLPRCPERPARLCNTLSALRATSPVRGSQSKNNLTIMSFRACEESHGVCGAAGRCLYLAKLQGPQTKWAVAGGRRGPPLRQESSFNACRGLPRCPERPARLCNTLSALRATSPVRGSQSKNNLTIMSFRACEESHGVCGAAGRCLYLAKLQGPQTKWAVAGGRRGPPLRQESSFNACRGLPRCPERPARLCNTLSALRATSPAGVPGEQSSPGVGKRGNTLSALRATSPVRGSQSKNNLTIMSFRACEESHGVCGAAGRCLYLAKLQGPQTKWAVAGGRRGPPLRQESSFKACRGLPRRERPARLCNTLSALRATSPIRGSIYRRPFKGSCHRR